MDRLGFRGDRVRWWIERGEFLRLCGARFVRVFGLIGRRVGANKTRPYMANGQGIIL